jgi:hypothetical protein
MGWLQDRRLVLTIGGGVLALLVSLAAAGVIVMHGHGAGKPPPASVGGLVVQMGQAQDSTLDPKQPLRCFVNGQLIGMETLTDCAKKNGVATQALDVGVASGGAPAAAAQADASAPSGAPAGEDSAAASETEVSAQSAARGAAGDCLRYGPAGWRRVGDNLSLSACVQALFNGLCEPQGGTAYGRWMTQTLRLSPHRVEISPDNVNFHPVAEQADGCLFGDF